MQQRRPGRDPYPGDGDGRPKVRVNTPEASKIGPIGNRSLVRLGIQVVHDHGAVVVKANGIRKPRDIVALQVVARGGDEQRGGLLCWVGVCVRMGMFLGMGGGAGP